jgi:gamma-glutamyltranspeptidase
VPVLVARYGQTMMAIGTPGAAGQPLTLAQVLARVLACGQDTATAIHAPRWSVGLSGQIIVERAAPASIINALSAQETGLETMSERHVRFGSVKAVVKEDDALRAAADYRRVAAATAR